MACGACLLHCGADAVVGDEGLGIGEVGRDAGAVTLFAAVGARGDVEVEGEELFENVIARSEAVGGEDGGIERGVGLLAVRVASTPVHLLAS